MPDKTFVLDVVTPERVVLRDEVASLVVPGVEGYLGVLAGHAPLMTELRDGEVIARHASGSQITLRIGGGFMEVAHDRVVVLADSAETAEQSA